MGLKVETFTTDDGEDFHIREASAFRTLAYSKGLRKAGDDEVKQGELTSDFLRHCVLKSKDGEDPRWTEETFADDVSIRLFQWLTETVKKFNGLDQVNPIEAAETAEAKN